MVGKRIGVSVPPLGEIPLDSQGLEDDDAFFAAAKSPIPTKSPDGRSHVSGSPSKAYGKRAEKVRERERLEEEKRRRREELKEEGLQLAILNRDENDFDDDDGGGKPRGLEEEKRRRREELKEEGLLKLAILNRNDNDFDDDSDGDGGGKPRARDASYQPKPKQPYWLHRINNGESGSVWSETLETPTETKIVSKIDNRTVFKLPLSSMRKTRESKVVGFASQSFNVPTDDDDLFPGYTAGNLVLPPRGIKDAEGVGLNSIVFTVGDCLLNSLEFAIADPSGQDGEFDPKTCQRFLLGKGDMFQVPPGNIYRLENHSKTVHATLFWTIIKCTNGAEQEGAVACCSSSDFGLNLPSYNYNNNT